MMAPLGTSTEGVDLPVRVAGATLLKLAARSVAQGLPVEALVVDALAQRTRHWNAIAAALKGIPVSTTSRNGREGRFAGVGYGKAVRWRGRVFRTVKSAKARAVMRGRIARRAGTVLAVSHLSEQGAR